MVDNRSRNCAASSDISLQRLLQGLLQGGDIVGKHSIQRQRTWTRTVIMTGGLAAATMWMTLAAAGTAEAKTHHGPGAPGNPFSTPTIPFGVGSMQFSATMITRHSTTTSQYGSTTYSGRGTGTSSSSLGPVSAFNIGSRVATGPGTSTSGPAGRAFGRRGTGFGPAGTATGLQGSTTGLPGSTTGPTGGAFGLAGIGSEFGKVGHGPGH